MSLFIAFFLIIIIAYVSLVFYLRSGLKRFEEYKDVEDNLLPAITIIIAARNEEKNIERCLDSILSQNYPEEKLSVVVIDDNSEDQTSSIVDSYAARFAFISGERMKTSFIPQKKAGIEQAVRNATTELICLTDADTHAGPDWLRTMASSFLQGTKMVCGPVRLEGESFLQQLQSLEFAGLIGITSSMIVRSAPVMCNGANLLFSRDTFLQVDGYSGNSDLPTGDDVFLMQKISKAIPGSVSFCHSRKAIVTTLAPNNLNEFLDQRVRWASKVPKTTNYWSFLTGFCVLGMALLLLLTAGLSIFSGKFAFLFLLAFATKSGADTIFLYRALKNLGQESLINKIIVFELLYFPYFIVVFTRMFSGRYSWKGRVVRI